MAGDSDLDAQRWKQADELLQSALERPPDQRLSFLREACGGDETLFREVESLISYHERSGNFLDRPLNIAPGRAAIDRASSLVGCRIGPYEILSLLGSGGMGEVYRAVDTRLNRTVAIKFLPAHLSRNPGLRNRFEREARAVSSLNHPHICTLYDIGRHEDVDYLVMEYLDGETLANRLTRKPMPLEQALVYGIELADALSTAHRIGLTHRDVKPSNIMLGKSGCKLLDFGLAKWSRPPSAEPSPVILDAGPQTVRGMVLGTVQYMAPEQLEGGEADARADIFAFGAVLYEMVSGRKAFEGRSQASLIAAILTSAPPPITSIQPVAPRSLDRLIQRCLAKDPEGRWQSAQDLKSELEWIAEGDSKADTVEPRPAVQKTSGRLAFGLLALGLALGLILLAVFFRAREDTSAAQAVVFPVHAPEGTEFGAPFFGAPAISPDGSRLVYSAMVAGQTQWYLKSLQSLEPAKLVAGTEAAHHPFWSPDGNSLGFFADGKLKIVSISGGVPIPLCDVGLRTDNQGKGGTWNRDGDIVFAMTRAEPLYRVSASGGECKPVTKLRDGDESHVWPYFLPDGKHFVYVARRPASGEGSVHIGSLDSPETIPLFEDATWNVVYAPPGYLLFVKDENLMAQPFDPDKLQKKGEAVHVANPVAVASAIGRALFSASENGRLVFFPASGADLRQMVQFDRKGERGKPIGDFAAYRGIRLSPDEEKIVHGRMPSSVDAKPASTLGLLDLVTGQPSLFNADITIPTDVPVWSADGNQVFFSSRRIIYRAGAHATAEKLLEEEQYALSPIDASRNGQFLLVRAWRDRTPGTTGQMWLMELTPKPRLHKSPEKPYTEREGRFSPDNRMLAYSSDELGDWEIYVRSLSTTDDKVRLSEGGGSNPVWRSDGKEIVYLSSDRFLTSVTLDVNNDSTIIVSKRERLFPVPGVQLAGQAGNYNWWDMTRDAKSFFIAMDRERQPLTVVVHWTPDLSN